ncbi:MAG: heavy metal translocating P-type ATPase [Gammaproteobacteria bacterium]|nr:heavy metal translocating P-type ATPase [Gammaproteobacteria bacterium]
MSSLTRTDALTASPSQGCFHCGLPVPEGEAFAETIDGQARSFCCIGCQSVCKFIYDSGLEGFYQRTPDGTLLAPPPPPPRDVALFDLEEVQEEFITRSGAERSIHLLVEGIHCAACVWLIERTLGQMPGVLGARVNLSGKRVQVSWDGARVKLSTIIQRLGDIGYSAVPYDPEAAEGRLKKQDRDLLFRMAFAAFAASNLMWTSIALYSGASQDEFRSLFHWVGLVLALPTLLYSGWPFFKGAWTGLRNRHPTMDLPIALGATVTFLYSLYITLTGSTTGEVYYDTVVNFLFIILIGRYLEGLSRRQAVASTQRLLDLQPKGATVLREGREEMVPIRAVKVGELVLVRPGDKIAVDGEVQEGRSAVNEAMLTGESVPVAKTPGDKVSAGTLNQSGALTVRVEATLRNTALGRIIQLVEEAQASKAPIQCTADRIVPWFVFVTLALASVTFLFWVETDFEVALMAATSVLIITCPCAFGLATPMAIAVASGLGARHGILVKNGAVLETLSKVDHVVFDKTGTLTEGRMRLTEVATAPDQEADRLLAAAAAVERLSEHVIGKAVLTAAKERGLALPEVADFESMPGLGVRAWVAGERVVIGTESWLAHNGVIDGQAFQAPVQQWEAQGTTSIYVAVDGTCRAVFGITDELRADAPALVESLRRAGIRMTLLSGDRRRVAEAVAERLGGMSVIAEVLPEDKDRVIAELQARGDYVAMVGDGVNDAPALTRAHVGIAIGSGTDVSVESADIVLVSNELDKVRLAIRLSQRTLRTIKQNIGASLAYNVVMIPLAMAAFITPLFAAVAMPFSSLFVIANAARIRTLFKQQARETAQAPRETRPLEVR